MNQYKVLFCLCAMLIVGVSSSFIEEVKIECVPLHQCPKFVNLLKVRPLSKNTISLLQTSHCGFHRKEPKVWCPIIASAGCITSDGGKGTCTPIHECPDFLNLVHKPEMVEKAGCKNQNGGTSICCPMNTVAGKAPLIPDSAKDECGIQAVQLQNKIIGGDAAGIDEFPWAVLLEYNDGDSTSCGGTLINNQYVVTAAHCVDALAVRAYGELTNVILGEYDTRNKTDCTRSTDKPQCSDPVVKAPVANVIIHPQWYSKPKAQIDHDIALIRLANPVKFTNYIKPICLPSSGLVINEQTEMVITGWGQTEYADSSFIKLKATIRMANREQCVKKYKRNKQLTVGNGEICVGGEKGKDSCVGDSGGPLMLSTQKNGKEIWFLTGIVSFGPTNPCDVEDFPGLYTFLPNYIDWIYKSVEP